MKSFVELTKLLLQITGVKMVLSEKFSQDPLEEHFAKQRRSGGANENPTLYQFGNQELALNVMKSGLITDLRGNTRGIVNRPVIDVHDRRKIANEEEEMILSLYKLFELIVFVRKIQGKITKINSAKH